MTQRRSVVLLVGAIAAAACGGSGASEQEPTPTITVRPAVVPSDTAAESRTETIVADGRLATTWQDFGWASIIGDDRSVTIDLTDFGGWIVARPGLDGNHVELRLEATAPTSLGERFLLIGASDDSDSPARSTQPVLERDGETVRASVDLVGLGIDAIDFDRVVLQAADGFDGDATITVESLSLIERVASGGDSSDGDDLAAASGADTTTDETTTDETTTDETTTDETTTDETTTSGTTASGDAPGTSDTDPEDGGDTNDGGSTTGASADDAGSSNVSSNALVTSIDCAAPGTAISPHVYGIAQEFGNMPDEDWSIGATARRWGGNTTSRYNWRTGHWNTAFDYFWQNVSDDGGGRPHEEFLDENARFGLSSAVTIPMLGWVAGDDRSGSFPVSVVGEQQQVDPFRPDLGNGVRPDGSEIEPPAPSTTSIVSTPDDARAWISSMRSNAAAAGVDEPLVYFLDNEPMLWDSTHRDVFTEPLTYQGLLERTIAYGTAIREAAPDALIAGPSVWGWPAYFFSAADAAAGFDAAPDRRANGGEPLIEWYLAQVRAHEERTGIRLLDVLDVHFYPQDGSYTDDVSDAAVAQRLRSTRSLWDPTYTDPSWIEDTVKLIPRMQDWVDEHAPGTLLSIGEYSFGAEFHISGGLAQAEALGRFGQLGVFAAYYWDVPPSDSSVYWAFRAYTDYDGDGASFGNVSLPVEIDRPLSIFASTTDDRDQMTAVVMNQSLDESLDVMVDLSSCPASAVRAFRHGAGAAGLDPISASLDDDRISLTLPPLSLTVLETT